MAHPEINDVHAFADNAEASKTVFPTICAVIFDNLSATGGS
tara:strand:+ start:28012 stop:28134 length:123 start_codon:yes stop_codon:yes gene_type:complete